MAWISTRALQVLRIHRFLLVSYFGHSALPVLTAGCSWAGTRRRHKGGISAHRLHPRTLRWSRSASGTLYGSTILTGPSKWANLLPAQLCVTRVAKKEPFLLFVTVMLCRAQSNLLLRPLQGNLASPSLLAPEQSGWYDLPLTAEILVWKEKLSLERKTLPYTLLQKPSSTYWLLPVVVISLLSISPSCARVLCAVRKARWAWWSLTRAGNCPAPDRLQDFAGPKESAGPSDVLSPLPFVSLAQPIHDTIISLCLCPRWPRSPSYMWVRLQSASKLFFLKFIIA